MANDATPGDGKALSGAGYTESDRKLRKELSFTQLLFLSLGGIIGSGWLFAVSSPFGLGIAGPAVVLAWVIGGILVMIIALTYAEIAGMLPRTGAIVRYPSLTHGGYTGSIIGWAYLLSAVSVPAIEAIAVVTYASVYFPSLLGASVSTVLGTAVLLSGTGVLAAFLLLVAFFFLNFFGIKLLGRFNQGVTWWKLIIPVLTFIFLFSAFHASNFTVSFPAGGTSGFAPYGWAPVFESIALAGIIFSYLGFRQALDFGGEAKNPGRNIPLATILSVTIGIVVYTLLQLSFIGAINWGAAGIPVGDWKDLSISVWASTPFYSALGSSGIAFLGAFASLLLVDAWISPAGTGWIYLGTSSRTFYGLSADGFFGRLFLRMNRWGIPWVALVASIVVGTLFLVPFPSWYLLVGFITLATTFTYIMGGVAYRRSGGTRRA
ncbi:amino acid permease-associated region [mine drainage metagenome]|uniref:Amino acid permease-associated region n=1 Tax=mine drainage metagenome TaxID=410659 RepID=T0YXV1_9ZZZZ